jgi:hypothetical protein
MQTRSIFRPIRRPASAASPKRLASLVAFVILVAGAAPGAEAASLSEMSSDFVRGAEIAYDVTILRPLNAAATVLGVGFFVASAPLVAPFEGLGSSWEVFVYAPYEYTVMRGLGDF